MRPKLPFDLNEGYDRFRDKDRFELHPGSLDPILTSVLRASPELLERADFVTWRGALTFIMTTPYCREESWHLEAQRVGTTIFLNVVNPPEKIESERKKTKRDLTMCYWGFSFEDKCCNGGRKESIDCEESFISVVKTKVGNNRIVMGGEVDCCTAQSSPETGYEYLELKTTRNMQKEGDFVWFKKKKLIKWWAQSFLLGVQTIIAGYRDNKGICTNIGEYKTLEIPRMVREVPGGWDGNVCIGFLHDFLEWLKMQVISKSASKRFRVEFNPRVNQNTIILVEDDSIPPFISQEYLEHKYDL